MAYNLIKKYPENFSKDITDVISALTLKHGEKPILIGSGAGKLNYPSDFDLMQAIPLEVGGNRAPILEDLQEVIGKILKMKGIYIGDIKSGELPYLKVVPDDISAKNYDAYRPLMIKKLNKMKKDGCITKDEHKEAVGLLQPNLTDIDIYIIKHDIRFEVIRWTAEDILNGCVNYRGHKIGFYDYLIGQSLTKIDVISWLNGIRYNEITMVYVFTKNGKPINKAMEDFEAIIIEQMPYLIYKEKYMKIAKRIGSIEKLQREPIVSIQKKLYKLFNSDLARLNQVISDITALQYIIENVRVVPEERFEYEIDQIKYRLGVMTNHKYLKKQNVVIRLLDELEKDVVSLDLLEKLHDILLGVLEPEVKKYLKKMGLLPVPQRYLPLNIK